jgi:predicted dehydrogenase
VSGVRVGVVGAGRMGSNHLRVYSELKGVELIGFLEPDDARAAEARARFGCRRFRGLEEMAASVDAATVASPSSCHARDGLALLESGVHCLVEKPLATTEDGARALVEAAERNGVVLLVGHIERFNPVVTTLTDLLHGREVHAVEARRMSAVSARITDVDVASDLMVHDLDIVQQLAGGEPSTVMANAVRTSGAAGDDYVNALLSFSAGTVAAVAASRITQNKIRQISVTSDVGFVTADYSTQELLVYRQGSISTDSPLRGTQFRLDLAVERVYVTQGEPLVLELRHFVDAVQGEVAPRVTGEQAIAALRTVSRVQASARQEAAGA